MSQVRREKSMKKVCANCSSSYIDTSKWKRGKTCSKQCASALMKQVRYSEGTYVRAKEACEKDQISKRKKRKAQFEHISKEKVIEYYENLLTGEITRFPLGLFQFGDYEQRGVWLVKYLIEDKLQLTEDKVLDFMTLKNLNTYKLHSQVLQKCFNKKLWNVIDKCYPGKFKKWDKKNQNRIWTKKSTTRPLIKDLEELLSICREEARKENCELEFFSSENLKKLSLYNSAYCHFNSLWGLVDACFPDKYQQWELKNQNNIWTKQELKNYDLARKATKWLIEDKLKIAIESIPQVVKNAHFRDYGLESMITCVYGSSFINALIDVYPQLQRNQFPLTMDLVKLGYEFEHICKDILIRVGKESLYNSKHQTDSLVPDLILSESHWGDIKLTTSGYYSSSSSKYLDYCDRLTIVYLIKNAKIQKNKRIDFITIDRLAHPLSTEERNNLKQLKDKYYQLIKE